MASFRPPWHEEQHHRPEGMIALCVKHHRQAEGGVFGPSEIRKWKMAPNSENLSKTKFDWYGKQPIIRLGGCYSAGKCLIVLKEEPILNVLSDDGRLSITFTLKNEMNAILATMQENFFTFDPNIIHDLTVSASAHRIKIWFEERQIGFLVEYSRKSIHQVEDMLQMDEPQVNWSFSNRQGKISPQTLYEELQRLPNIDNCIRWIGEMNIKCRGALNPTSNIIRWYALQALNSDGNVPVLNFVFLKRGFLMTLLYLCNHSNMIL